MSQNQSVRRAQTPRSANASSNPPSSSQNSTKNTNTQSTNSNQQNNSQKPLKKNVVELFTVDNEKEQKAASNLLNSKLRINYMKFGNLFMSPTDQPFQNTMIDDMLEDVDRFNASRAAGYNRYKSNFNSFRNKIMHNDPTAGVLASLSNWNRFSSKVFVLLC